MSSTSRRIFLGDRDHLIESHLGLVRTIARRYHGRGEPLDDLIQVGAVGLIRASDRFDPARGVAFATFAKPAIEGEIRRHLAERAGSVRIPRELHRISGELQRSRLELTASLGREPTADELASAAGFEPATVERALTAERAREPVEGSPDEALEGVAGSGSLGGSENRVLLAEGARVLNERERRIVFLRFHADRTEEEIAKEVGISQAHVSRLLSGALFKLRAELGGPRDPRRLSGERAGGRDHAKSRPAETVRAQTSGESKVAKAGGAKASGPRAGKKTSSSADSGKRYSGRFLVRISSSLHEKLTVAAEREETSLNRFVTKALEASVSLPAAPVISLARVDLEATGAGHHASVIPPGSFDPRQRLWHRTRVD